MISCDLSLYKKTIPLVFTHCYCLSIKSWDFLSMNLELIGRLISLCNLTSICDYNIYLALLAIQAECSCHNYLMISYYFIKMHILKVVLNTLKLKNLIIFSFVACWRLGRTYSGSEQKLFYTSANKVMRSLDVNSTSVLCNWSSKTDCEITETENQDKLLMKKNINQWCF